VRGVYSVASPLGDTPTIDFMENLRTQINKKIQIQS
jgi:hypothetical protein